MNNSPRYTKKRKRNGRIEIYDSAFNMWIELKQILIDYPHLDESQFFTIPLVITGDDIRSSGQYRDTFAEGESGGGGAERSFEPEKNDSPEPSDSGDGGSSDPSE